MKQLQIKITQSLLPLLVGGYSVNRWLIYSPPKPHHFLENHDYPVLIAFQLYNNVHLYYTEYLLM